MQGCPSPCSAHLFNSHLPARHPCPSPLTMSSLTTDATCPPHLSCSPRTPSVPTCPLAAGGGRDAGRQGLNAPILDLDGEESLHGVEAGAGGARTRALLCASSAPRVLSGRRRGRAGPPLPLGGPGPGPPPRTARPCRPEPLGSLPHRAAAGGSCGRSCGDGCGVTGLRPCPPRRGSAPLRACGPSPCPLPQTRGALCDACRPLPRVPRCACSPPPGCPRRS